MKKLIYTLMLILAGILTAYPQRMLPGKKGLEINAGILPGDAPKSNYYLNGTMTVNGKNGNYQLWALEYSRQHFHYKDHSIPQETYSAEAGYSFFILGDISRNIALNTSVTALAGYESINKGETNLFDGAELLSGDNFIYGGGLRLSLEIYLSDYLVLVLQARLKALWGTDLERLRPSTGAGLRFNL
ncbi:conjugal transfer protein TraO [Flavobacterium sp. LHD-85]|uniref:conjugal transfer protein TraO n=1 Tax=Flavobacterium sp. LHD-85 TaxID=3071410 RepID=UPI0027E05451|nr:conjugal transfer protein TraO [Flavobacterium sp. LHD-85]MDQ6532130.1 conjugal transfer protein TraO [Flavobacterium sp. LHD-85]